MHAALGQYLTRTERRRDAEGIRDDAMWSDAVWSGGAAAGET